jgi:hypothetical protein
MPISGIGPPRPSRAVCGFRSKSSSILPHLHGAEFKVLLILGRQQARGGGRDQKPFPSSIPQIMEDTGLSPRAISQAISRLDKHHLILRVKKHGALPNRYRVLLEPAAPNKIPKAKKPARASRREPTQSSKPACRSRRRFRRSAPAGGGGKILVNCGRSKYQISLKDVAVTHGRRAIERAEQIL